MASVTDAAARVIEAALGGPDDGAYAVARMVRSGAAWNLKPDREMPGDECIEWEGRTILVLDPETSSALAGAVLDVHEDPSGPRLILTEEQG